jgi:hypothetical protein
MDKNQNKSAAIKNDTFVQPETLVSKRNEIPILESDYRAFFDAEDFQIVMEQLLQYADESAYSPRQWMESLYVLQQWLDRHDLKLSANDQLGYINCAAEYAQSSAHLSYLPDVIADMLATYGCEHATKKN